MLKKKYLLLLIGAITFHTAGVVTACEVNVACNLKLIHPGIKDWDEPVLTATDTIKLGEQVQVKDQKELPGKLAAVTKDVEVGKRSKVGSIYAAKNILLKEDVVVTGHLAATTVKRSAGAIAPSQFAVPGLPTTTHWTTQFKSKKLLNVDIKSVKTLEPGRYQKVVVQTQAKMIVKSGVYYFDSLETLPKAEILLENKKGTVLMYIRDQLIHMGRFTTKNTPSDVMVVYFGVKPINVVAEFDGSLVAPLAEVIFHSIKGKAHDGIFYAKNLIIKDGTIIRGVSPTRKGPVFAELRSAVKEESTPDFAAHDSVPAQKPFAFSDTPTGQLLTKHLTDMYGYGPNAEAQYQANLELLRQNAKLVVNELTTQYEKTPTSLEAQESRWNLVQIMSDLKHPEAYESLKQIAQSEINTVDTSAIKVAPGEHPIDGEKWENMIRSRAIDGLSQLAKNGHYDANEALLRSVTTTSGVVQRYAVMGYLDAGTDFQSRANDLRKILPEDQQYLINLNRDISAANQPSPTDIKPTAVQGAGTPEQ